MSVSYIHFETDINCRIYKFGVYICDVIVGEDCCLPLRKGAYKLRFESLNNSSDYYEIVYNVDEIDIETFYTISIAPIRDKRLIEEDRLRKMQRDEEQRKKILERKQEEDKLNALRSNFVDLGLSVKWATCNLGATSPELAGGYYAWGEIQRMTVVPKEAYKFYRYMRMSSFDTSGSLNDSVYFSPRAVLKYGKDGLKSLQAQDDAVTHVLGTGYRIPTDAEWDELYYRCTWIRTMRNGVEGYIVRSKVDGFKENEIFIPFVGYYSRSGFDNDRSLYWTSRLGVNLFATKRLFSNISDDVSLGMYCNAMSMCLKSSNKYLDDFHKVTEGQIKIGGHFTHLDRISLLPIRPICDKDI